jgi:hypothetical protein
LGADSGDAERHRDGHECDRDAGPSTIAVQLLMAAGRAYSPQATSADAFIVRPTFSDIEMTKAVSRGA